MRHDLRVPPANRPATPARRSESAGAPAEFHEMDAVVDESGVAHPAVLKIHRGQDARGRALAEAAALSSARHAHVVELLDVGEHITPTAVEVVDDGEPGAVGLVLERLRPETAGQWLERRGTIDAGEMVTLVVPLLRATQHLYRSGVVLGALTLEQVLFDERGAPVLVGVRHDASGCIGMGGFLQAVLHATRGGAEDARHQLERLVTSTDRGPGFDELIETVLDLAEPVPLGGCVGTIGAARRREGSGSPPLGEGSAQGRPAPERGLLETLAPGFAVVGAFASIPLIARLLAVLATVRPRVWMTAALVVTSAVVALALSSPGDSTRTPPAETPSVAIGGRSPSEDGSSAVERAPKGRGADVSTSNESGSPSATPTPSTALVLSGDDVTLATDTLLGLRDVCLRQLDATCLAGVDQAGSSLLADDVQAIGNPDRLSDRPTMVQVGSVINDLGGTAVLSGTDPRGEVATILVIKGKDGWRLREVLVG